MQLVGVAQLGRRLVPDPGDGVGVEGGQVPGVDRQAAAQRHRPAAPLLEGGVVEEGVGPAVEDLVGQRRRLGGVPAGDGDGAALEASTSADQALDVHGLVQAVVHRLADQHMVGDRDRAGGVLLAGGQGREHRRHQVVGLHALDGRRVLGPPRKRSTPGTG